MGERVMVRPGPLDGAWAGADVLVPTLPSQVAWLAPSPASLVALEQASRGLGRLEWGHRHGSLAGLYAMLHAEAVASATLGRGHCTRPALRDAFLASDDATAGEGVAGQAGMLLRQLIGMRYYDGRTADVGTPERYRAVLECWPSALSPSTRVPDRWVRDLAADLASWVGDGRQPALVKAAIAMMVVAATAPTCHATGVLARLVFARVLEDAHGASEWRAPALSWGLHADADAWERIATVLAVEGAPDPDTLDAAMVDVLAAVGRAAVAGALHVEHASAVARQIGIGASGAPRLTRRQLVLIEALVGLPALSQTQAAAIASLTPRGVKRALKGLIDAGAVEQRVNRAGVEYYLAAQQVKIWPDACAHYELPGSVEDYC